MFRVGLVLFAVVHVHTTLARITVVPGETVDTVDVVHHEAPWQQQLPNNDPDYRLYSRRSIEPSTVSIQTTMEYTTEKSISAKSNNTAIANGKANPSWWLNISSGVTSAYNTAVSYTGPYLLPSLLVILLIGAVNALICVYTSVCDRTFSAVASGAKQIRTRIARLAIPYLSEDDVDELSMLVNYSFKKFSCAQNNEEVDQGGAVTTSEK